VNSSQQHTQYFLCDVVRNFTRIYGSSALDRGQLSGDVLRHPLLRVVMVSIFVVVIVVGALSNAAVLYAVTTVRCARSVASALIGNLAAADLWHCLFWHLKPLALSLLPAHPTPLPADRPLGVRRRAVPYDVRVVCRTTLLVQPQRRLDRRRPIPAHHLSAEASLVGFSGCSHDHSQHLPLRHHLHPGQ